MKYLIVVESPTKAKTIQNFLDKEYTIIASKGHVRDLPKHSFGIKIDGNHFVPEYVIAKDYREIVGEIKKLADKASKVFIATDEDREGEAIGYHIAIAIGQEPQAIPRIAFHEITKTAILDALECPRQIDMYRVNAQQARRLLDRIVGYKLSPLLSSKIQKGLSAGRVQSSALKIIVDREREIRAFVPIVYYLINATFDSVESELVSYKNKKIAKMDIRDKSLVDEIIDTAKAESFVVENIEHKKRKVSPQPPFMTSTLQQSASSQLGFSPTRTMKAAQSLYEGVNTHEGTMGVITYMRTDSLNIAKEAIDAVRKLIKERFGAPYLPKSPNIYASKAKGAQEAHEAIRPTNLGFTPEIAAKHISGDNLKLYTLIYNRFLASQMTQAEFELQTIHFQSPSTVFKANGRKLLFDGFYAIVSNEDKDKLLPNLKKGQAATLNKIVGSEHESEPPPRFSEASLIKTLESLGIGRPSTYAPTISLLVNRSYITLNKRQIAPEEIAFRVIEMLETHFNEIVDSDFTANMEEKLDEIAENKAEWEKVLWDFYENFEQQIQQGKANIQSQKISNPTGEMCPKCGKELVERESRYGRFVACSGYPKCKYIKPTEQPADNEEIPPCEKCGSPMVTKFGRNGSFLACSAYPECKNTRSFSTTKETKKLSVHCPKCGGEIVQRFSKRGAFFGCGNYPNCDFVSKFEPTERKCPECGSLMAERTLRNKDIYECVSCKFKEPREG